MKFTAIKTKQGGQQDDGLSEIIRVQVGVDPSDSLYTTGGVDLVANELPFRVGSRIDVVNWEAHPTYAFQYDRTDKRSGKVIIYQSSGGLTEVPNGTDLAALSVFAVISGR